MLSCLDFLRELSKVRGENELVRLLEGYVVENLDFALMKGRNSIIKNPKSRQNI